MKNIDAISRRAAELLYDSEAALRQVGRELGQLGVDHGKGPVVESDFSKVLFEKLEGPNIPASKK